MEDISKVAFKESIKKNLLDNCKHSINEYELKQEIEQLKQQNNLLENAYYDLMYETKRITYDCWKRFKGGKG